MDKHLKLLLISLGLGSIVAIIIANTNKAQNNSLPDSAPGHSPNGGGSGSSEAPANAALRKYAITSSVTARIYKSLGTVLNNNGSYGAGEISILVIKNTFVGIIAETRNGMHRCVVALNGKNYNIWVDADKSTVITEAEYQTLLKNNQIKAKSSTVLDRILAAYK